MRIEAPSIERIYLALTLLQTLAASLIWGINTLFLLDAGLSLSAAFVANAAFSAGMVLFEVPTGVIADAFGRRASFLLGAATLIVTTLLYLLLWQIHAALVWWVIVSALIGLGFTFFSGATEAWLVDALDAAGFTSGKEAVFGKGQVAAGVATLVGTLGGGLLAQISLGLPYLVRAALLVLLVLAAAIWMHDMGYAPQRHVSALARIRDIVQQSIRHGFGNPPVRLFMVAAPFTWGAGIWIFYAFQPYLLQLFGDPNARWLAGAGAAIFAAAQMLGGSAVRLVNKWFSSRTSVMILGAATGSVAVIGVGLAQWLAVPIGFWLALALLAVMATGWALQEPLQQAYINDVIPSERRATVLSLASLMGSAGGVFAQPALARVGDLFSLGSAYLCAGALFALQLPFLFTVRALRQPADSVRAP